MNGIKINPTRTSSAFPGLMVAGGLWLLLMALPKFF
jgi:hypothetical protein